ncbi:MAG: hypothetical protein IPI08_10700 [Betaproteobacteria bacterium]|nr:hypothetical protein [Betaproteobacteria bacterium]
MDRFDRVVVALGRRWSRVLRVASVGFGVLFASTIATNSAAADCSQITGWSNQDATFFPVERVTRIDRSNAPGRFYFKMDSEQEKTLLVTYFTLRAGPKSGLTKDQLFSNSVSVGLYSFGSAADANGMFNREVDTFNVINPNYWGYSVGPTGTGVLSYYSDRPGNKEFNYFAVHQNTIISIQLRSASETEDLHSVGVAEMVKRAQRARSGGCQVRHQAPEFSAVDLPALGQQPVAPGPNGRRQDHCHRLRPRWQCGPGLEHLQALRRRRRQDHTGSCGVECADGREDDLSHSFAIEQYGDP